MLTSELHFCTCQFCGKIRSHAQSCLGRHFLCVDSRYVDDYFACLQPECVEHGLACFAELVRLLLGKSAVSDRKLGFGNPLCVLGLDTEISALGMTCVPSRDKVVKWLGVIAQAIHDAHLTPGAASKLAGGLSWAAQNMFHRSVDILPGRELN